MIPALLAIASYLIGALPFGYAAGRLAGVDLTTSGSGNTGATNVFRLLGPKWALPVIVLDLLKGFVPVWLFPLWDGRAWPAMAIAYGIAAVAGHVWSVFLRFQGGKGVATAAGVMLALAPIAVAIAGLIWLGVALITGLVSVASLLAATLVPVLAFLGEAPAETVLFAVGIAAFVWWTHRSNLGRLIRGEELSFREDREPEGQGAEVAGRTSEAREER